MTSLSLSPSSIKSCLSVAKIVKPVFGDFSISLNTHKISFSSLDKRRAVVSVHNHGYELPKNEEFFLPLDRINIFDLNLDNLQFNISDKGLNVKHHGGDTSKSALLKRRADNSKRPNPPSIDGSTLVSSISSKSLDNILKAASCSALVKDTKTEEDMRVNQVYFYASDSVVVSNARFYASYIHDDSINFDLSLVSSDIPFVRNFCNKYHGQIYIYTSDIRTFFVDHESRSFICFNNVSNSRPILNNPKINSYKHDFVISMDSFKEAIRWVSSTLDGTQRFTMNVSDKKINFKNSDQVLASFPVDYDGNFSADFPIKVLQIISDFMFDCDVRFIFGIESLPDILILEQVNNGVRSRHFIRSMKSK